MTIPDYSYLILNTSSYYKAICIEMNQIFLISETQIITNVLHDSATDYQTNILAVDHHNGSVFAITENNEQDFILKHETQEVVNWIQSQNNMNWSVMKID